MTLQQRIFTLFLLLLCFAFASPQASYAAPDSPVITKEEWAAFLHQSARLQAADAKLNATYKQTMAALSPVEKKTLLSEQRAWIDARNREAFTKHAKGSAAYLEMLAAATLAREESLRAKYPKPAPAPAVAAPSPTAAKKTDPVPAKPASQPQDAAAKVTPQPAQNEDLVVKVPAQKPRRNTRKITITPKKFAESYNALAYGFRAPSFPLVPANVSSHGDNRTESYPITEGISIQFKYTNGAFEQPETITFLAHSFVGGTTAHRDNIAYALVGLLKSLSHNPAKDDKAKDAEIFGFMRSINNAFTSDSSRVWKNDGLVYVITYLKKSDLFAMVVNVDEKQKR